MLKCIWKGLVVLMMVVFMVSGCVSRDQSTSSSAETSTDTSTSVEDPLADGVLNIATDDTMMPTEFRDENNNLVGFDIDFANALAEQLGVKADIQSVSWDGIFTGLQSHQYDVIISSVSITPERQKAYSQSDPYVKNGIVITGATSNSHKPKSISDLDGYKVGTQIETSADTAIQKISEEEGLDVDLQKFDDMFEVFSALEGGQIDYAVTDIGFCQYFVNQHKEDFEITTDVPVTNEPICVTAAKDNEALTEKINDAIAELHKNGTLTKISEKWYGEDLTSDIDTTINVIE